MNIEEMATQMFGTPSEREERDKTTSLKDVEIFKPQFYRPMFGAPSRDEFVSNDLKPLLLLILRDKYPNEDIEDLIKKGRALISAEIKQKAEERYKVQFKVNRQRTEDEVEHWKLITKTALETFQLDILGKRFDFVEADIPNTNVKYDLSELLCRWWGVGGKTREEIKYELVSKWDGHTEKITTTTKDRRETVSFFVKFMVRRP